MTFRRRLMLASLTTLAVGLGALIVAGNVFLEQRVSNEVTNVLRANADAQVAALQVTPSGVHLRPSGVDLDLRGWILDGDRVIRRPANASPALDTLAVRLGRERRQAEVDGPSDTRLWIQPVPALRGSTPIGAVVVVASTESLERVREAVLLGSLVIAGLLLVAGGLAIRSAVNGALQPVAQMTETAHNWGASDLEQRFDLGPPRDELTALAATLDELLGRISASRRHEQRFAGEVAHELRTPLAGLRGRAELALRASGPDADARRREALETVVAQADRLGGAIDTLLAVARQELDPTDGSVDLAALAAEIPDVSVVRLATGPLPLAEGDADVVRRAIAPLVDNARRHARSLVRLELSAAGRRVRLAVCDDGPGVDPELGERIFDPGVRGSAGDGAGLGLPLARRLARSCGGDVRLDAAAAGGRFVLELPVLGRGT